MAKIIVYNNDFDRMETYQRKESDPMPYNLGGSLKVSEFRGASKSSTLWTSKYTMQAWNTQRQRWGSPINVGYAFRRPWEGGHGAQSQHYAGTAFDVGQGWTDAKRAALRADAQASGLWSYIEPVAISPTWVHLDRRQQPYACASGGYPQLQRGSKNVYVLILQDSLNTRGFATGGLDGIFGAATRSALTAYQSSRGLPATGIADCSTWQSLLGETVGKGRTPTTVD